MVNEVMLVKITGARDKLNFLPIRFVVRFTQYNSLPSSKIIGLSVCEHKKHFLNTDDFDRMKTITYERKKATPPHIRSYQLLMWIDGMTFV